MSTIKTVLITGINGYIASVTGLALLKKGYKVRGTARSKSSTESLIAGPYAPYASQVEFYEVPDMVVPGAFDEAVKGVSAILHMASPVSFALNDPEKVITPAVHGAVGILDSALAHAGPQLEVIMHTSSVAAIYDPTKKLPYVFTEKDWNNFSVDKVKTEGSLAAPVEVYRASKTSSEKAVWKWVEEKKPPFALAVINPGVVYGAPAVLASSPEKFNETLKPIWKLLSGEAKEIPPFIGTGTYVDVEDVAKANIFGVENPAKVNGQRYICVAGQGMPQAIADILREEYPDRRDIITPGNPGEGYGPGYAWPKDGVNGVKVDGGKVERDMGFTYKELKQSVLETAKAMEKLL